jgi:hypothetical protein
MASILTVKMLADNTAQNPDVPCRLLKHTFQHIHGIGEKTERCINPSLIRNLQSALANRY